MKARQYASENQAQTTAGSGSGTSQTSSRLRAKNRRVSHCCAVLCFCVSALTWGTQTRRHDLHRAPPLEQNRPREVADHVLNPTRYHAIKAVAAHRSSNCLLLPLPSAPWPRAHTGFIIVQKTPRMYWMASPRENFTGQTLADTVLYTRYYSRFDVILACFRGGDISP